MSLEALVRAWEPQPWRLEAACAAAPREMFFPPAELEKKPRAYRDGKSYCARCPVRTDCLAEAMCYDEPFGLWGGLDPTERDHERRRRLLAESAIQLVCQSCQTPFFALSPAKKHCTRGCANRRRTEIPTRLALVG